MPQGTRKSVYVQPENLELWADLETLAAQLERPMASLVLQALEEFALLQAYRGGKAAAVQNISIVWPTGYHDPLWDGSEAEFRDKVVPARMNAIAAALNEQLPGEVRIAWVPAGELAETG